MNQIAKPLGIALLFASMAVAEVTTVPVEIQSVDASNRTITVRFNGKVSNLSLSPNATITVDGKAADLTSVIPGGSATVEFDKAISAVTKIDAQRGEIAPAEALADGWEEIDQRLLFLMVRLVDVEANLEAIDNAMGKNKVRAGMALGQANRAAAGNERMDRRAGGPVRWDKFYGTTAEKFFYHPTQNHTYHTQTVLSQKSPGRDNQSGGVPSSQGVPTHQRPPQFDYMYRANETARQSAFANVAKFRGNAAALAVRHHELELEQGKLWCEVAFRAVARNDLDRKPLYRFAPQGTGKEGLLAASNFVVTALSIVTNGQKDQASTFRQIKPLISKARYELGNKWLQLGVKSLDESTDEWRFVSLARRLEDVSANLGDSYIVSVEREGAGDADRRDLYRGLLQQALLQYAETVLALDEMASEMAKANGFEPDLDIAVQAPSIQVERLEANIPEKEMSETQVATESEKPVRKPTRSNSRQRPKTISFQFNDEQRIRQDWILPAQSSDWQIINGSLQLHGHHLKSFASRFEIEGDCQISLACWNKGWGGPSVHIFGERLELPGPNGGGPMSYRVVIARQGNKLTAQANNKRYNLQIKQENLDAPSKIRFTYTDHNNSGIRISRLMVTASKMVQK